MNRHVVARSARSGRRVVFAGAVIAVGLMLVAWAGPASAGVVIGVKGGPAFASLDFEGDGLPGIDQKNRTGTAFGANLEFEVLPVLWLRFEPMYIQRGGESDWPESLGDFDNTQKFDYFAVPVNLKVVANFVSVRPYAFAGVTAGWLLDNTVEFTDGSTTELDLETFDLGVDLGVGIDFVLAPRLSLGVDARYTYGVTDLTDFEPTTVNNRTTLILAGVNLSL